MTTLTVLDSLGATQTVAKVLDTGRAAALASLPTVMSTEDKAVLDAVATQATSAAILAKLIAAPATDALQTALNASVGAVADAAVTNPASSASTIAALKGLLSTLQAPETALTNAGSTSAYQASSILRATPGRLYRLDVYNSGPGQWLHVGDFAALPANGVTVLAIPPQWVDPKGFASYDFGTQGLSFAVGVVAWNSTTDLSKTIGAADCFFRGQTGVA